MREQVRYIVRDKKTGEIAAEGTSRECADKIGSAVNSISGMARKVWISPKWDVERVYPPEKQEEPEKPKEPKKDRNWDIHEAIRKWDEFCEPLRKKYGIEVKPWP